MQAITHDTTLSPLLSLSIKHPPKKIMTLNFFRLRGAILAHPYVAPVLHIPFPQICSHITNNILSTYQNQNNHPNTTFLYVQESNDSERNWVLIDQENDSLSEEVIAKYLRTRKYNEVVAKDEDELGICVVCQDDLGQEKNQTVGVLNCGHVYHDRCIRRWLMHKNVCPLCKATGLNFGDCEWENEGMRTSLWNSEYLTFRDLVSLSWAEWFVVGLCFILKGVEVYMNVRV